MTMNVRRIAFRIFLLTLTIAPATFVAAKESLSIRVSPAVSFAPANLVIRTTIEPDASNRAVEIVADSADFFRSSAIELDGERAPRTTMFEFRSLPAGEYHVQVSVIGADGRPRAVARSQINVVESGASR